MTSSTFSGQRIERGDVLDVMRGLRRDGQFDAVLADPPYNVGKDFGDGGASDERPLDDYLQWCDQWINEAMRLVRDGGLVMIYGFPEIAARIAARYPIENQRWLAWHYTNKTVPSSKFWQRSHETILCLWKGKKRPSIDVDAAREPYSKQFLRASAGKIRRAKACRYSKGESQTVYAAHQNGALPRDVIKLPALAGGAGRSERWFLCRDCNQVLAPENIHQHALCDVLKHPTQKPLELSRRLLAATVGKHGAALIPFAGCGSECVAAQCLGIQFLGIELNPDYIRIAEARLAEETSR